MTSRRYFIKSSAMAGMALWFRQRDNRFSYTSNYISLELSGARPSLLSFSTNSLGYGRFPDSPLLADTETNASSYRSVINGRSIRYYSAGQSKMPAWEVRCGKKEFSLRTQWKEGSDAEPFSMTIAQKLNHSTVLGAMTREKQVRFPCVLHLPGMGTFRVYCNSPEITLFYDAYRFDGPHEKGEPYIKLQFTGANAAHADITYRFESVAIYPDLPVIKDDKRFDGFRRNYINIFQMNPRIQCLANNSASDACAFALYFYAEMARQAPELVKGITAHDLIRNSLDQYLGGMKAYGQVGYKGGAAWLSDYDSSDSAPSLIISAAYYILDTKDYAWAQKNYDGIKAWADKMIATDKNNDGIIEYGLSGNSNSWDDKKFQRPANWWDTIGFGHDDAYSNVLAYRACLLLAQVSSLINKKTESEYFNSFALKLKNNFFTRFYNPGTGVLGGWRSQDGQLHDYYFLFVNSMAITYGLIEEDAGKKIMEALLAKMKAVGYTDFSLGLPGNLIPVADMDYAHHEARWGYQQFQVYENGGATGCYAYYTIHALFKLGMRTEAEAILYPMLEAYREGGFEGRCPGSEMTKDWKTWTGACWGYEGFLVDNFLSLLAVHDI